jgi:hypothetical protein
VKKLSLKSINKRSKNKGSALVLTLIITNLMLLLGFYLTSKIENLVSYNNNLSKYILQEDIVSKQREYVMAKFNTYFSANLIQIIEKTIPEFFKNYNSSPICYDKATIKYDKSKKEFLIETEIGYNSILIHRFIVEIKENTFKYKFLS